MALRGSAPESAPVVDSVAKGTYVPPKMRGTIWMGAFLLAFAVIPALIFGDSNLKLVVGVSGAAFLFFASGDFLSTKTSLGKEEGSGRTDARLMRRVLTVFWILSATGIALLYVSGTGAIGSVATGYSYSTLGTAGRTLSGFAEPTVAIAFMLYSNGLVSRKRALVPSGMLVLALFVESLAAGYLGGAALLGLTYLFLALLTHALSYRWVAGAILAIAILLPPAFVIRDDVRELSAMPRSSESVGPFDRFRVDRSISGLQYAEPVWLFDVPDLGMIVRTAVVPRMIDPNRPTLNVGQQINYALGNSNLNNQTFGNFGNALWLWGPVGLVLVAVSFGFFLGTGIRYFNRTWGAVLVAPVIGPAIWPEATMPNSIISIVQVWIASIVTIALLRVISVRRGEH